MDGAGEYRAKRNKPNPKNQRSNVFSGIWMINHNKQGGAREKQSYFRLGRRERREGKI